MKKFMDGFRDAWKDVFKMDWDGIGFAFGLLTISIVIILLGTGIYRLIILGIR